MSKIDELIEKLCPNGVEYKKTKEIKKDSFWLMPATPYYISEGIPYITAKNIKDGKINFENVNYISQEDYINISANRKIEKNDLLVTMIGTIGETAFVEENTEFYGQNMYLIRLDDTKINRKFYNYYLTSPKVKNLLVSKRNISNQGYIKAGNLEELSVPVPPLEIQREIVDILDKFTALLAELKAELKARKKQYAYYRDKLFEFEQGINYLPLKELCKSIKDGMHNLPENTLGKGKYPILSAQNIFASKIDYNGKRYVDEETYLAENKRSNIEKGDVLLTIVATIGRTAVVEESNKFLLQRSVCILKPKELINSYYLKFYLDTYKIQDYMIANAHGAAQAGLYLNQVAEILVPVPPLEEQEKIANILEKFDKLCNSLCEGIPAEIEARQKQYEYYRDKLLTFKKLESNE